MDRVIERITGRKENLFAADRDQNRSLLEERLEGRSVLVIGGAGSIGSQFIREILRFRIRRLFVADLSENGLAELIRDLRSSPYPSLPELRAYPVSFSGPVFEKILRREGPFEVVANFAAHKHVRSEKDEYAIEAMFGTNFMHAAALLEQLSARPPERFFCVSTDKATNPVSIMGATKKLMETVIFGYRDRFNVSTARFANVAFSNGSLPESYLYRVSKLQPVVCPSDISRYFVSPGEAGTLCLLACMLGRSGDIFIPKLSEKEDLVPFTRTAEAFFEEMGLQIDYCKTEEEARKKAAALDPDHLTSYPVYLFRSDTSGEKPYEEFYTAADQVDRDRFRAIGVIPVLSSATFDVGRMMQEAVQIFGQDVSKESLVKFLERYVPGFAHVETGRSLDQKM
jgi:FlaA1/EpsC-like NDP-sugar epimerase